MKACLTMIVAALVLSFVFYGGAPQLFASSDTIVVTRTDDPVPDGCAEDDCSLREAVIGANESEGADQITIPAGTYVLEIAPENASETDPAHGDLDVTDDLTISGAGPGEQTGSADVTIIDADGVDRVFHMFGPIDVTISGVRIRNGEHPFSGGAVLNSGADLTITNSVIEDSSASSGGGVSTSNPGTLTLDNVHVLRNESSTSQGGGVFSSVENGLTISNSTIADNTADGNGGGIYTAGMMMEDSTVTDNHADIDGGGIISVGINSITVITNSTISSNVSQSGDGGGLNMPIGSLDISDSEVSGNTAGDDGGGIFSENGLASILISNTMVIDNSGGPMPEANGGGINVAGTVVVEDSTVSGNTTGNDGGGIVTSGPLTLTRSTVSNNEAGGDGGGIDFDDGMITNPQSLIWDTAISGNTAQGQAGGIDNDGHLTILSSTVSGNQAVSGGGGGIENDETVNISNSTISGNEASTAGGGMLVQEPGDTVSLHQVTIANNAIGVDGIGGAGPAGGGDGAGVHIDGGFVQFSNSIFADNAGGGNCGGILGGFPAGFQSNGYNLEDEATCPDDGGDINNEDPLLGPLADNGGPTMTHALDADSPAVDAAVENCPLPETDQRGIERPQGEACDIGAYELVPGVPQMWGDVDCNNAVGAIDGLKVLQEVAALPYEQTDPCFPLDEAVGVSPAGFGELLWGDVDCNGTLSALDALAILRHVAALPMNQEPNCPEIGAEVLVVP